MHWVKKLTLGILSALFVVLLFVTAFDVGFVHTATNPTTVKKLVADSGIYDSVIPNVLRQTGSIDTSYGSIPTSDPDIQKAANVALPPQYIQQNTEMAIDNIYQWLNGQIAQPDFSINLNGAKTLFANNVADAAQKRLSALPACAASQNLAIAQNGNFDAYSATCLPAGVSPASIAEQLKDSIVNSSQFLDNTNLSAANIKNGDDNQPLFQQSGVKNLPQQYQRAKKTPWILGILTVLTGTGIVFLSRSWQKGLWHIGLSLIVIGLVMLILSWALNRTVSNDIAPKIKVDNAALQTDFRNLITDLVRQIDRNYRFFGGLYILLGAVGIAVTKGYRRRSRQGRINPPGHKAP